MTFTTLWVLILFWPGTGAGATNVDTSMKFKTEAACAAVAAQIKPSIGTCIKATDLAVITLPSE